MKKSIINNNMWILRWLIYFLLFICIFSFVFSLVNAADTITIMDIQKGDLNAINWNDVPAEYIPFVPVSKLPYDKLLSIQRKEMTVEQIIANLDKIENLAGDVNQNRARLALRQNPKTLLWVENFGSGLSLNNGILRVASGEKGRFDTRDKRGWKITVSSTGKIEILDPKKINEKSITSQDDFTINEETKFLTEKGDEVLIKSVSVSKKQFYIQRGVEGRFGDYVLLSKNDNINLYFDLKFDANTKPAGTYLNFRKNGLDIMTAKTGEIIVKVLPGNRLFNMVKREYEHDAKAKPIKNKFKYVPDERDHLQIKVAGGDSLSIFERTSANPSKSKIPLLTHNYEGGSVQIESGRLTLTSLMGNVFVPFPKQITKERDVVMKIPLQDQKEYKESAAFEFQTTAKPNTVILVSSGNRFVYKQDRKYVTGNNEGLEVSNLLLPNMMKTLDDMKIKYPNLKFAEQTPVTKNTVHIMDQWLRTKPGVEKYLQGIAVGSTMNTILESKQRIILGEYALDPAEHLNNPIRAIKGPLEMLYHEFDHVLIDAMIAKEQSMGLTVKASSPRVASLLEKEMTTIVNRLYDDNNFAALMRRVNAKIDPPIKGDPDDWSVLNRADAIDLGAQALSQDKSKESKELLVRLKRIIEDNTGMDTHSFGGLFLEVLPISMEVSVEKARKNPQFIQMYYDMVMGMNPPGWLKERARTKYYNVMGDSCKVQKCGACLIYKRTCAGA